MENPGTNTPDSTHDSVIDSLHDGKTRAAILVVEDDPSVAELLNSVLKESGYHVCVGEKWTGRPGLGMNYTVDGILLDMHMPLMSGRTMLDEFRALPSLMGISRN
ncbi:response regulator [Candidatus Nitrospira neomarina]|uniref:Response regulator n=1 Tax=Candidatus Nitrospira neomarina TaxID=3020899 RepID=A0AA96GK09_9BACT|nr:response regulator [Candidatus Nitrospira neomarina]WNM61765.1 response regulator [Candidatus Nitrospira neomarina]